MVDGAAGLERRALLIGAAGAALAGCGSSPPRAATEQALADARLLGDLLALERHAGNAYASAGRGLRAPARRLAGRIGAQERAHARDLAHTIYILTGKVPPATPAGVVADASLRALERIENRLIAAYIDALPKFSLPLVRVRTAAIMANEAQHLSLLAAASGAPPAPRALVTGAP